MPTEQGRHLMLTGPPGCGKTTVILRLAELLRGLRLAGFYTRELWQHGQHVGFETVGLSSGLRATMAHVNFPSRQRVGRYGVDSGSLEPIVKAELENPTNVDAFLIDEIGKMELLCPSFSGAVTRLLDGPVPVVATVALKGSGLIAAVKKRPDVRLVQVTVANRDGLAGGLAELLRVQLSRSE
jgi:nucleoside-triphosphatase